MAAGRLEVQSPECAKHRDELQAAGGALRDQRERVAERRPVRVVEAEAAR